MPQNASQKVEHNDVNDDPIARAAAQVGDRWSLLIIWAAANGVSRFDDFHRDLNVARNILSNRLRRLVDLGILEKRPVREGARRKEYALTEKGQDLRVALEELRHWGGAWNGNGEIAAQ
jgi:DNA-binding HxlR family transcriptional regulator